MKPHPYPSESGNDVHFIQTMQPSQIERDQWIEMDALTHYKAEKLWDSGMKLKVRNDDNIITVSCAKEHDLEVTGMCINGPQVLETIRYTINEAYTRFIRGKNELIRGNV